MGIYKVRAQNFVGEQNTKPGAGDGYGDCIITRPPGHLPTSAEYAVTVPVAGDYAFSISYAAAVPRPISITVNGQQLNGNAASASTGGWFEGNRVVEPQGITPLNAGQNTFSFFRGDDIPHLHEFIFAGP